MNKVGYMALGTAAALLLATQAQAVPSLRLTSGATTVTIADGGAGDAEPTAGVVTFIGPVGVFDINVSTGVTKPANGSPAMPDFDLNSINSSNAGGTLTVEFTETGFTGSGLETFSAVVGGTTQGTSIDFDTYVDTSNTAFGTATQIADISFATNPFSGQDGATVGLGAGATYSLTTVATIVHGGAGTTSFNHQVTTTPEPATLGLIGAGLAGVGLAMRRRRVTAAA